MKRQRIDEGEGSGGTIQQLIEGILIEIAKEGLKKLCAPVQSRISDFRSSKENVEKLREIWQELEATWKDIKRRVDADEMAGQVVDEVVNKWLGEVGSLEKDVKTVLTMNNSFATRHQLGKEAREKAVFADGLLRQANFITISHPPPPPAYRPRPVGDFEAFNATTEAMKKVMDALEDKSKYLIGIYGMGGVGKTTLMKEIGRRLKVTNMFDAVVFVVVSQTPDMKKIQREIAVQLGLKLTEESEYAASTELANWLKKKKILIMLDDLWARLDLIQVGIPYGAEAEGCKILLTTRNLNVNHAMRCHQVHVNVLSDEDSWELFRSNAEAVVNFPFLEPVAREVATECRGLPLAIVVVGRAVGTYTQINHWEHALEQLRRSSPTDLEGVGEVFNSIELSYTHLSGKGIKSLFLFCCLFPEDYEIHEDELTSYLMGEDFLTELDNLKAKRDRVSFLVVKLIDYCLLLTGNKKGSVKMHDVVRDVAKEIASRELDGFLPKAAQGLSEWPGREKLENRKRISLMNNDISTLPDQPKCNKLYTLLLRGNQNLSDIPKNFFKNMGKLTVLDLSDSHISFLPLSLSCLTNLKTLCLDGCKRLHGISEIGKLERLEVLRLRYCGFELLPEDIGKLANLKLLDLTSLNYCRIPANVMGMLSALEELYMIGCTITEAAVIAEIASLRRLAVLHVELEDGKYYPQDIVSGAWENLREFKFPIGKSLAFVSNHDKYQTNLAMTGMSLIAESVKVLFRKTENLALDKCKWGFNNLVHLDDRGCLVNLKSLELECCDHIEYLFNKHPEEVQSMVNLNGICHGLRPAHSFGKLRHLKIVRCGKLVNIIPWELMQRVQDSLEELIVVECNVLQEVFHFEGHEVGRPLMANLRYLNLQHLPNLTSIWNGIVPPETFHNLECIDIRCCELLQEVLHFEGHELGHPLMANLRYLNLQCLPNLTSIWNGIVPPETFHNLERIEVDHCELLQEVLHFEGHGHPLMANLRYLSLQRLPNLTSIWSGIVPPGTFQNLECIKVHDCKLLQEVFHFEGGRPGLAKLRTLILTFSFNITRLWSGVVPPGSLQNLKKLEMLGACKKLTHIFSTKLDSRDHFHTLPSGTFSNLKEVRLWACIGIKYLFLPTLAHELRSLEILEMTSMDVLEDIIFSEDGVVLDKGVFPRLKHLRCSTMPMLRSFYHGGAGAAPVSLDWPSLVSIRLERCPNLKRLLIGPESAPKLMQVDLPENDDVKWFKGLEWEDPSILSRFEIIRACVPFS